MRTSMFPHSGLVCACLVLTFFFIPPVHAGDAFTQTWPVGSAERRAADFLYLNMPMNDKTAIPASILREMLDCSFVARSETPWARQVPFDIFLHYVLPPRLIDEPFKPGRKFFHDQLAPLVRDCPNTWEAILRVNQWCAAKVEYLPSSDWLTAPIDMFKVGYGRCEELVVLLAAAARSVGIPVRGCWVPGWRHADDNHVWLEVWDRGEWLPLEAGSDVVDPNENWFLGPSRAAPAVYSLVYGELEHPDDPVHRRRQGLTVLNLTGRYAKTACFPIACLDRQGRPLSTQTVYLWTLNSGRPWIVAKAKTDDSGTVRFLAGKGSYIATAGDGTRHGACKATEGKLSNLDLRRPLPDMWSWTLDHPSAASPPTSYPRLGEKDERRLRALAARAENKRKVSKECALTPARKLLGETPGVTPELTASLERCWPQTYRLAKEYAGLPLDEREWITPLLLEMDPKDLAISALSELADHLRGIQELAAARGAPETAVKEFYKYIAPLRVAREPLAPWVGEVAPFASDLHGKDVRESADRVVAFLEKRPTTRQHTFTSAPTISQLLRQETQPTLFDKATLGTAMLRSFGIPAKVDALTEGIDFLQNGQWRKVSLNGDRLAAWPTDQLIRETGNGQLVLFDQTGRFIPVNEHEESAFTLLPQGELLAVELTERTPQNVTCSFRKLALPTPPKKTVSPVERSPLQ